MFVIISRLQQKHLLIYDIKSKKYSKDISIVVAE